MTRQSEPKTTGKAYLWLFTLGLFGAHHFYLGNSSRGYLYAFTFGVFTIGWMVDIFMLSSQVRTANMEHWNRETARNTAIIAGGTQ